MLHATSCATLAGRCGQTGSHGAPKDRKSRTSCWTSRPRLSLPLSGSQDPSPIMGSRSGTMTDEVLRAHGAVRNDESQLRRPAERPLSLAFAVLNVLLMIAVSGCCLLLGVLFDLLESRILMSRATTLRSGRCSSPAKRDHNGLYSLSECAYQRNPTQENCHFTRRGNLLRSVQT